MKLKVEILTYKQLSPEAQEEYTYHKYSTFLRVSHEDKEILFQSDHLEPEDVRFSRDLYWVPSIIKRAYELGLEDGIKGCTQQAQDKQT